MNLKVERNKAMYHARKAAYTGNHALTQAWLNRANSFWPVSSWQFHNLQRLLDTQKTKTVQASKP